MEFDAVCVSVVIEYPDIINVGIWRKFKLGNFKYTLQAEEAEGRLVITYELTKLYDSEGKRSQNGVNYKYILYGEADEREKTCVHVKTGYRYRAGSLRMGETVKDSLVIPVNNAYSSYRLVIAEYGEGEQSGALL